MRRDILRNFILLILIVITVCLTGCSHLDSTQQPPPQLRILTYNVHHCQGTDGKFDYNRIAKIINDLRPDVVALQEVDRKTNRSSGVDQAAVLAELTGLHHAFGRAIDFDSGQYGLAILSRLPISDVSNTPLQSLAGSEPRIALSVRVEPCSGIPDLTFIDTHLCHLNNQTRSMQTKQLNEFADPDGNMPVILAGDFNARPGSQPMNVLLDSNWLDAVAPQSRIDYVLLRKKDPWEIIEVRIIDEPIASDHNPVIVTLRWSPR